MTLKAPVVSLTTVYHVGTLDPKDKGMRGPSYEGKGLSVTTEPDAWISIAQLGGLPTHTLSKTDARFLDFYACVHDKGNKKALYQWGYQKGYLAKTEAWQIEWYDDEWDRTFCSYTDDREEAGEEREDGKKVRKVRKYVATDAALDRTGIDRDAKLISTSDVLCLLLSEEIGLDGVWWDDDLDEGKLSAPRGCILPDKLPEWEVERG